MSKYRKRPVVIDAEQYNGMDPLSVAERIGPPVEARIDAQGLRLFVKTLEGDMLISPGDWIITGINGERYPCKPDIFDKTYEPVPGGVP